MLLAVIGSGLMGGGIALDAARHGLDVWVYDAKVEGFSGFRQRAAASYERWVKSGRMAHADAEAALDRLMPAASIADVGRADVVVEAVFEELGVKRQVLNELADHLGPETIVATNTSALRVTDVAEGVSFGDRIMGLHYFSPADVCRLVEVVRTSKTSDAAIKRALTFLASTHRTPLSCIDRPGFAINRFFCPYYNEAVRIVDEGHATASEVDFVARERLGVAAGPFAVINLIGVRVAGHAMANLGALGPFYQVSASLIAKGQEGGGYELQDAGYLPASADLIEDRLLAAIAIPALELSAEGVAAPFEIDNGAIMALRFKRGPYALMRAYPAARLERAIADVCARHGHATPRNLADAAD